ncbi:MAG: SIR2 family protein [Lachnospiraceae bacterium]|nr:SIR2 family protein [Lachnospiraceae bacterium]
MELNEAIQHAIDGDAVLFLGAGFSCDGKNKNGESLPSAGELSKRMCREMGVSESTDLATVSDMYIDHPQYGKGVNELIKFLKNQCLCLSASNVHNVIIDLPWKRIYTANYDNIPEICSRKSGIERETITATLPHRNVSYTKGAIVHLNGYIQDVTEERFFEEFKITNSSYLRSGFLESEWAGQFIRDINTCKAIIFVGYSMKYDLELRKVMSDAVQNKAIFIDRHDISEEQKYIFEKWGTFYPIEVEGLAKEIEDVSKVYSAPERVVKLDSLEEIQIDKYHMGQVTPNDVVNLLVYGKCDKYDFRKSDYYLERNELLENVKSTLQNKKICLLHANLGNGKSIALFYLMSQLVEDYRVYVVDNLEKIQEDLELLKQRKSNKHLIVVDDYDMQMSLFRELGYDFEDNIKVLASCRTSMSEILLDSMMDLCGISDDCIGVINIEIITDDERRKLINLLDNYNLWGTKTAYSKTEKNKLILKKYKNRLSSIFYMLLESNVISDKLNNVLDAIKKDEVKKYLYAQAVCDICNFKLRGYEIAYLSESDYSEIEKASSLKDMKEVFVRTSECIELRSAVFSQYLIKENRDYEMLSGILIRMYKRSVNLKGYESDNVRKKLISRSNLIEVFGGRKNNSDWRQRDKDIYAFYCSIQNDAKTNPFFWLQYAITALNLEYYVDAKIYFENAYSYASELDGFDSFQLDTHYARFLLEEILKYDEKFDFDKFTKAHRLLMDSSNAEIRLSYVLRQVGIYGKINQQFQDDFGANKRMEFIADVKEVISKFEEYFSAVEKKKKQTFYFAVEKSVRKPFKRFRDLLFDVIPLEDIVDLDKRYNHLVSKNDRVRVGKRDSKIKKG